jgi:REP element-mobilizing transposase RayT
MDSAPTFEKRIWQRNYYEHIIRNEKSYYQIAGYIRNNPIEWQEDKYYVQSGLCL